MPHGEREWRGKVYRNSINYTKLNFCLICFQKLAIKRRKPCIIGVYTVHKPEQYAFRRTRIYSENHPKIFIRLFTISEVTTRKKTCGSEQREPDRVILRARKTERLPQSIFRGTLRASRADGYPHDCGTPAPISGEAAQLTK